MKILLVYTNIGTFNPPHYQHGVGALSAFVRRAGHETALISLTDVSTEQEFLARVASHSPDVVGFHANSAQWSVVRGLAQWLRGATPELPLILGGTHATTLPEEVLRSGLFDYLVVGEGEHALTELLEALANGSDPSQIANLGLVSHGETVLNPVRPLIDDLDLLPIPDRDIFDFQALLDAGGGEMPYMAGRGCPFACNYCCNNFLQKIYAGKGRYVRFRSPTAVVEELEMLRSRYRFETIYFQDDTFTLDMRWLREFAELYVERVGVPYRAQARMDLVDEEMVDLLASSGCHYINFGIEAGDERIRREVLGRRITDAQIVRAFELARSRGMKLWSYNIIGSPGEGEEEIRRTIELNRRLEPDHVQVSIFNPYPGTELYHRCLEEGTIGADVADSGIPCSFFVDLPVIERSSFSDERLKQLYDEFVQLGLQMSARRSRLGYFDLMDRLEEARVEGGGPGHVNLQLLHLGEQERLCLFDHPPARISYEAPIRSGSRLRFGIALNPQVWDKNLDGVRFQIFVDDEPVFEREVRPAREPDHRAWLDCEVGIESNGRPTRTVTLATEAIGLEDFSWAVWSQPHLVSSEDSAHQDPGLGTRDAVR